MRRRARETALKVLYMIDVQPEMGADEALARYFACLATGDEAGEEDDRAALEPDERGYASELVRGVAGEREAIDRRIVQASRNWRLERMARVDRNLIRLAVYELTRTAVPAKVAINEAIEIAKRFGAHETSAFINGILDRILDDTRPR